MRIADITALSGFARNTAESASDFTILVHNLVLDVRDSYRPACTACVDQARNGAPSLEQRLELLRAVDYSNRKNVKARHGRPEMTSSNQFNAFVAARGEGLHPKLRDLLERAVASPHSDVSVRHDGLLQAGPDPASEMVASRGKVVSFPQEKRSAVTAHEPETQKPRKWAP